jgi:hypothetical protein
VAGTLKHESGFQVADEGEEHVAFLFEPTEQRLCLTRVRIMVRRKDHGVSVTSNTDRLEVLRKLAKTALETPPEPSAPEMANLPSHS